MKVFNKIIKLSIITSVFCFIISESFIINSYSFISKDVKIIGHRGASALEPENTIPAYEKAAQLGMWGAETDVFVLKDNNIVIFHDSTVDRMTNGSGNITDMTLDEVKKLKIDCGNNIDKYKNLKIPTFEEYLSCCREKNLVPVVELKHVTEESISTIVNMLKEYGFEDKAIILSTSPKAIKNIRKFTDKIQFQYLGDITVENIDLIKDYGNCGIDIKLKDITKEKVDLAHSKGCTVNVWTVNDKSEIDRLLNMGVDMITSDLIGNTF